MRFLLLAGALALAGCAQAEAVHLVNAKGQTATCGPYYVRGFNGEIAATMQMDRCLNDYQAQGFVRAVN